MPRTHPADTTKIAYRLKPPEVWAAIKAEWEAGASPAELARRFDVSASSVQHRRDRQGWSRTAMLEALASPADVAWVGSTPISILTVAEASLARALQMLLLGKGEEAVTLLHASEAVGCYAEYVQALRADLEAEARAEAALVAGGAEAAATAEPPPSTPSPPGLALADHRLS